MPWHVSGDLRCRTPGKHGEGDSPGSCPLGTAAPAEGLEPGHKSSKVCVPLSASIPASHPHPFTQRGREKRVVSVGKQWGLPAALAIDPSCSTVPSVQPCPCLQLCAAHPVPPPCRDGPPALLSLDAGRTEFYSERLMI